MPSLNNIPLFEELKDSENILIAGAGGGFDIFCGLPLYFSLKAQGKKVYLANYSFTHLHKTTSEQIFPYCFHVKAANKDLSGLNYFPEKYLAQWFLLQGEKVDIYAFDRTGVAHIKKAYKYLIKELKLDAIVLVDGGTDSLMLGDEESLGTPEEDSCSMASVYGTSVKKKLLLCLGFGIDHFHGVSHYRFLENVAKISKEGGFLGCFSLLEEMEEFKKYKEALDYTCSKMPFRKSIVSNSIISAVEGNYGDFHRTERTFGTELWINPLMSLYWCFHLNTVVQNLQYYPLIKETKSIHEISGIIRDYRNQLDKIRDNKDIPL